MSEELQFFQIDFESPHRLGDRPEKELGKPKWLITDNDTISLCQNTKLASKFPSGMYTLFQSQSGGVHASKIYPQTDELYHLPNPLITEVVKEIGTFWDKAPEFKQFNIKHKRGILLHGPPGTGKTSAANLLSSALIKNDGLVFSVSNINEVLLFAEFINKQFRIAEPDRPIVLIMEDIDKMMDGGNAESMLLNFMDGQDSVDHIVVLGTSNRFDELNDLILRPSRFDTHVEILAPTEEVRKAYLIKKGLTEDEAAIWAEETQDFSLAALKELFVSVRLLGFSLEKGKERINDQTKAVKNTTFKKKTQSLGFGFSGKK
jgi:ATP-dependent 26S proteasome regulatory subunit